MKRLVELIKNKKGEAYIDFTISFYIIMIAFIIIICVMPIFSRQQDLDTFAKTLVRQAEIDGTVEQDECYNYLCEVYNIKPSIDWSYDSYKGTKKVQLNKQIKVELETTFLFNVGGVLKKIEIPLKSIAYGKSEVYWK